MHDPTCGFFIWPLISVTGYYSQSKSEREVHLCFFHSSTNLGFSVHGLSKCGLNTLI